MQSWVLQRLCPSETRKDKITAENIHHNDYSKIYTTRFFEEKKILL